MQNDCMGPAFRGRPKRELIPDEVLALVPKAEMLAGFLMTAFRSDRLFLGLG